MLNQFNTPCSPTANIDASSNLNLHQSTIDVPNDDPFWCHVCQRQFRSRSALYQHGKRLSHLKRAMRISSSRCTTITNGKVTSSVQRSKPLSVPTILVRLPSPPPPPPPSSLSEIESTVKNQIIIRKHRHETDNSISYTCDLCGCRCWSIRNIRRHIRLHADARPFVCSLCQVNFKSHGNLAKHLKTSRHQEKTKKKQTMENSDHWSVDMQALEEQNKMFSQVLIVEEETAEAEDDDDDEEEEEEEEEAEISTEHSSSVDESNNLLEDLPIPDSRLIDGDADELALIDPSTFEELHKAAECLLNLQGVFYFGEDESGNERLHPLLSN